MSQLLLLIFVGLTFFLIYKKYNTGKYTKISRDKKMSFKGDLENHEAGILVSLMAKVAKADGNVCELEAELISNTLTDISERFSNSDEIREKLKNIYSREKESFDNLIDICEKYLKITQNNYEARYSTFAYLVNLAFIDGEFSNTEKMIIEDIASSLQIDPRHYHELLDKMEELFEKMEAQETNTLQSAYDILQVNPNDDLNSIKKAYRKLVKENHPDIVKGQGGSQDDIQKATTKLQEINSAYELIKKEHNR